MKDYPEFNNVLEYYLWSNSHCRQLIDDMLTINPRHFVPNSYYDGYTNYSLETYPLCSFLFALRTGTYKANFPFLRTGGISSIIQNNNEFLIIKHNTCRSLRAAQFLWFSENITKTEAFIIVKWHAWRHNNVTGVDWPYGSSSKHSNISQLFLTSLCLILSLNWRVCYRC